MAWVILLVAGLLEVVWAFALKQSEGFTRLGASAVTIVSLIASLVLLSLAMRTLPLGTAYTVWTGIACQAPAKPLLAGPRTWVNAYAAAPLRPPPASKAPIQRSAGEGERSVVIVVPP